MAAPSSRGRSLRLPASVGPARNADGCAGVREARPLRNFAETRGKSYGGRASPGRERRGVGCGSPAWSGFSDGGVWPFERGGLKDFFTKRVAVGVGLPREVWEWHDRKTRSKKSPFWSGLTGLHLRGRVKRMSAGHVGRGRGLPRLVFVVLYLWFLFSVCVCDVHIIYIHTFIALYHSLVCFCPRAVSGGLFFLPSFCSWISHGCLEVWQVCDRICTLGLERLQKHQ